LGIATPLRVAERTGTLEDTDMRAEAQKLADGIKEALALLRRSL
jgi:hypothetical protein